MAHKLFSTEKIIEPKGRLLLETAISFPGYKTWLYFDTGRYETWNIHESKLTNDGQIESDATLKFHYFDDNSVAYYSKENKKIEVLNVDDG